MLKVLKVLLAWALVTPGALLAQNFNDDNKGCYLQAEVEQTACFDEIREGKIVVPNALVDGEIYVFTTKIVNGKRVKVAEPAKFDSNKWMVVRRKPPKKKIYKKFKPRIVKQPPKVEIKEVEKWTRHQVVFHLGRGFDGFNTQNREDASVDVQPNEDIIFGASYGYKFNYRYNVMGTLFNNGNLSAGVGINF